MKQEWELEEELIRAATQAEEIILQNIPLQIKEHDFSPEFENKMKKLIKHQKRKVGNKWSKRAAVVLLILGLTLSIGMSVEAVRLRVIKMMTVIFDKFTAISYERVGGQIGGDQKVEYRLNYIPKGFVEIEKKEVFEDIQIIYENKSGQKIVFMQVEVAGNQVVVDTENTEMEKVLMGGEEVYYYENKGSKNLIWFEGEYQLTLISEIDKKELEKMYKSTEIKK